MIKKWDFQEASRLYQEEGWSMSHISEIMGVTRQAIWKRFKKEGIETAKGSSAFWFDVECAVCGKALRRSRARFRRQYYHYCSRDCYHAMLQSGMTADSAYHGGRLGQMARWKAEMLYGTKLPEGFQVHHENRDRTDNSADNLIIFKSQGDHMRWHRGINVEPIWPNPLSKSHLGYANSKTFKSIKEIPKIRKNSRYKIGCECGWQGSFTLYMLKKYGGFRCPECSELLMNEF